MFNFPFQPTSYNETIKEGSFMVNVEDVLLPRQYSYV
jgi:hypothetical protein